MMGLRRILQGSCTALALLLPSTALPEDFERDQCMTLHNDREKGPLKDVAVVLRDQSVEISFTEWDVPNIVFDTSAYCSENGRDLRCQIDCDGGSVRIQALPGDRWKLDASGLTYSMTGSESLFAVSELDGGHLTGSFVVKKAKDQGQCLAPIEVVFVPIEPGDISPRVKRAEKLLNQLGYLLEFPDHSYDEATADAVRRFQASKGLPSSGTVDAATFEALSSAGAIYGGC